MPDPYANLIRRLLVACNLDPEVLPGLHEDAIVAMVQHKVAESDKRVEAAQQEVDRWREAAEVEHAARLRDEQRQEAWINAKLEGQVTKRHGELCWTAPGLAYALCGRAQAVAAWRKYLGLEESK